MHGLAKTNLGVCGRVTLGAESGRWCHPVHCGYVTSVTLPGGGLIQETGHVTLGAGSGGGVTLETVHM